MNQKTPAVAFEHTGVFLLYIIDPLVSDKTKQ